MKSPHRKCLVCGVAFTAMWSRQTYCTPLHAVEGERKMAKARAERHQRNLIAMGRTKVKRVLHGRGQGLALKETGADRASRIKARRREVMAFDPTPVEGEMASIPIIDTEAEAAALADFERRLAVAEGREPSLIRDGLPDPWS